MMSKLLVLGLLLFSVSVQAVDAASKRHPVIAGWIEKVIIQATDKPLQAKLDTGARTSSIHAVNIKHFEKQSKDWVKFQLTLENKGTFDYELPVVRTVKIKRHNQASAKRTVVKLPICMNGQVYLSQFTLSNRENYNYPVLLGRRFLKDKFIIDPGKKHLLGHENECQWSTKS